MALRELEDNNAIEPLLKAIFKPANKNNNGTLVYALEKMDCTHKLVELFRILFYQSYEAKLMACRILDKQIFEFHRDDLREIQRMWKKENQNTEKVNDFEDEKTYLMMQNAYEGFIEYLKE